MVRKYIGLPHTYSGINCITLIKSFYLNELGLDFSLPDYPHSLKWMKQFKPDNVDTLAAKCSKKVSLTNAKDYDVIVFKSVKTDLIIHFGMYLMPSKMLHIAAGGFSRVETLSDDWIESIHSIYRHDSLV